MKTSTNNRRSRRVLTLLLATMILALGVVTPAGVRGAESPPLYEGSKYYNALRTTRGAVATIDPMASQIGIDILNSGGNAIDAAVAMAFALGVVRPEMTGPGGGGFMVYRSADGSDVTTLDFREAAPADVKDATFREGAGIDDYSYLFYGGAGHRVVGVPGNIAGLTAALERYGTKSLPEVIDPAATLAEKGFIVSDEEQAFMFLGIPYLRLFPETAKIFLHDSAISYPTNNATGAPLIENTGDTFYLKQTDHARTLRLIADGGADVFYKGEIARLLVEDFEETGTCDPDEAWTCYPGDKARLTMEDLANYDAIWRRPIRTNYRGHEIIGAPPPASGGVVVAETLNILEGLDFASDGFGSVDHLHYLTEAMKIALADRKAHLADPDFHDVPVQKLTSKKYAAQRRAEIKREETKIFEPAETGKPSSHTTHLSVIDAAGNTVAMTLSLNGPYGSGVVAKGTGFLLNNHLLDFDTVNVAGQPSNGQTGINNAPEPGKRPLSAMSPTIVVRNSTPRLVVGGAGGPTILRGIVQAVINTIDFNMDVGHAIDAPRIFPANQAPGPDAVDGPEDVGDNAMDVLGMEGGGEDPRIADTVKQQLRVRGHRLTGEGTEYASLPTIEAVAIDLVTGERLAYADTRGSFAPATQ